MAVSTVSMHTGELRAFTTLTWLASADGDPCLWCVLCCGVYSEQQTPGCQDAGASGAVIVVTSQVHCLASWCFATCTAAASKIPRNPTHPNCYTARLIPSTYITTLDACSAAHETHQDPLACPFVVRISHAWCMPVLSGQVHTPAEALTVRITSDAKVLELDLVPNVGFLERVAVSQPPFTPACAPPVAGSIARSTLGVESGGCMACTAAEGSIPLRKGNSKQTVPDQSRSVKCMRSLTAGLTCVCVCVCVLCVCVCVCDHALQVDGSLHHLGSTRFYHGVVAGEPGVWCSVERCAVR